MTKQLNTAQLSVENGTPKSVQFDDIYFSPTDGVGESKYHFLDGNRLTERFAENTSNTFTIAETGFGTGLNFLLTAELWQQTAPTDRQLHYISVEKYPIPIADLQAIYRKQHWENSITDELLANYPEPKQGVYDIAISNNIRLTLLFGDAISQFSSYKFLTDAWFLDGFAPAKNPEMWCDELYQCMADNSQEGTTFATFTAASAVRKGLINAGFTVEKGKGFGRKRERLLGEWRYKRPQIIKEWINDIPNGELYAVYLSANKNICLACGRYAHSSGSSQTSWSNFIAGELNEIALETMGEEVFNEIMDYIKKYNS